MVLHGLFGSAHNWHSAARRLADCYTVRTLDMRNHGASPWTETMSYPEMAEDVLGYVATNGLSQPTLMGHSMGGKAAMCAALLAPARIARLIVIDIAPVRYRQGFATLIDALQAIDVERVSRRADAEEMLAEHIDDAATRGLLLQNLVLRDGRYVWRINLDRIAATQSELSDFPPIPSPGTYNGPTLFVVGTCSDYVRSEHRPIIKNLFPRAEFAEIAEAGHWVHAEQPVAFLAAVDAFLKRTV